MKPSTATRSSRPATSARSAARPGRPASAARRRPTAAARRRPPAATHGRRPGARNRKRRVPDRPRPTIPTRLAGLLVALGIGVVATIVVTIGVAAIANSVSHAADAARNAAAGPGCPDVAPVVVGEVEVPAGPIAGYCQDRLVNAAHIVDAAKAMGLGPRAQTIGVMTAMGESSLRNVDHGDVVGPDSRGLFQQRANGAWGSYADRMTPEVAATHFFERLVRVPGWQTMSPTLAAHAVQINADPGHYASYWPAAQSVVAALSAG